jgi:hypothetical protein
VKSTKKNALQVPRMIMEFKWKPNEENDPNIGMNILLSRSVYVREAGLNTQRPVSQISDAVLKSIGTNTSHSTLPITGKEETKSDIITFLEVDRKV